MINNLPFLHPFFKRSVPFLRYIINPTPDSILRNGELNLIHLNELKAIVQRSCMENMELPDRFTSTALGSPSGKVCEKFKLFEIVANLSQLLSDS